MQASLIIKGPPEVAIKAALARGVSIVVKDYAASDNYTYAWTSSGLDLLVKWFHNDPPLKEDRSEYPVGTLMLYSPKTAEEMSSEMKTPGRIGIKEVNSFELDTPDGPKRFATLQEAQDARTELEVRRFVAESELGMIASLINHEWAKVELADYIIRHRQRLAALLNKFHS